MWLQDILNNPLIQVLLLVLAIAIGWVILRFILKITTKIFAIGCLAIIVIGAVLFILGFTGS